MKKRIFKNWKSSLVGLGLIAIATAALLTGKCTLTEWGLFLPTGLFMIYAQDSIFKPKV
jgi:hypothetical protein